MLDPELYELCRKLHPLIGNTADQLWYLYATAETHPLRMETEGLIRAVALRELGNSVDKKTILLPPPTQAVARGDLYLGRLLYAQQPSHELMQRITEIPSHLAMIGTTGSGKSTAVIGLLTECLRKNLPFLVIDWKRAYRNLQNHPYANDLEVFTIGRASKPLEWNALKAPPGTSQMTWIKIVGEILTRSHVSGDGVGLLLMEAMESLIPAMEHAHEYHPNFHDLKTNLENQKPSGRKSLWHQSALRVLHALTYDDEATRSINARQPVTLEELLSKPVVFELDMGLPSDLRIFLSEVLFRWIHLYRLQQGETKQTRHLLVLEEAHNLLESNSYKADVHNHLQTLLRELRGFGQGVCILTQTVANLPQWLVANINTLCIFMLSHEADILAAKRALFLQPKEEGYLDLLKIGEALVKIKGRTNTCHVAFRDMPDDVKVRVSDEELRK